MKTYQLAALALVLTVATGCSEEDTASTGGPTCVELGGDSSMSRTDLGNPSRGCEEVCRDAGTSCDTGLRALLEEFCTGEAGQPDACYGDNFLCAEVRLDCYQACADRARHCSVIVEDWKAECENDRPKMNTTCGH